MIDYILDHFDFEKVHRAMVALDWEWASCDGVPEISDLRRCARRLLREADEGAYRRVAAGGFVAEKSHGFLTLHFEIDSVDGSDYDDAAD